MKPVDVNAPTCFNIGVENNDKNPKFKVIDQIRISKYKSIFAKKWLHRKLV